MSNFFLCNSGDDAYDSSEDIEPTLGEMRQLEAKLKDKWKETEQAEYLNSLPDPTTTRRSLHVRPSATTTLVPSPPPSPMNPKSTTRGRTPSPPVRKFVQPALIPHQDGLVLARPGTSVSKLRSLVKQYRTDGSD